MESLTEAQRRLCERVRVIPVQPGADQKVAIALDTLHLEPLNGLRHPTEGEGWGWYIWVGGTEFSPAPDFFQALHVAHLSEGCPRTLKYRERSGEPGIQQHQLRDVGVIDLELS